MKCNKCIFAKKIDENTLKCCNILADDYETKLFLKWDGCEYGKNNFNRINLFDKISLKEVTQ